MGQSDWDPFVVCTNFVPKDKSLGTPNEDDICKYFIHNHKNVVDVKFPRWNEDATFNAEDAVPTAQLLGFRTSARAGDGDEARERESTLCRCARGVRSAHAARERRRPHACRVSRMSRVEDATCRGALLLIGCGAVGGEAALGGGGGALFIGG